MLSYDKTTTTEMTWLVTTKFHSFWVTIKTGLRTDKMSLSRTDCIAVILRLFIDQSNPSIELFNSIWWMISLENQFMHLF
uniref:Uncharacterized protein n=1 Tax=Lepeophtheirus salmonis TaxID=72036 RepID=A0A0K2VKA2_LEPSM